MPRASKIRIALWAAVSILALAPFAYPWLWFRGTHGYYETGLQCACGHKVFGYIDDVGYYEYTPGHGSLDLMYSLRPSPSGWDGIRGGTNAFQLKTSDGSVFITGRIGTTNEARWFKLDRIYNPWRLWIPRLLPE